MQLAQETKGLRRTDRSSKDRAQTDPLRDAFVVLIWKSPVKKKRPLPSTTIFRDRESPKFVCFLMWSDTGDLELKFAAHSIKVCSILWHLCFLQRSSNSLSCVSSERHLMAQSCFPLPDPNIQGALHWAHWALTIWLSRRQRVFSCLPALCALSAEALANYRWSIGLWYAQLLQSGWHKKYKKSWSDCWIVCRQRLKKKHILIGTLLVFFC